MSTIENSSEARRDSTWRFTLTHPTELSKTDIRKLEFCSVKHTTVLPLLVAIFFGVSAPIISAGQLIDAQNVTIQSFPVGVHPSGVLFDGENIWVTNSGPGIGGNHTVSKLRPSDGTILGTFTVGDTPQEMAFDGANVWIANFYSDNVTKLRASNGAVLGTFDSGARPYGMAFDGANLWIANFGHGTVTELRASGWSYPRHF